jgi:hypothetical protein
LLPRALKLLESFAAFFDFLDLGAAACHLSLMICGS